MSKVKEGELMLLRKTIAFACYDHNFKPSCIAVSDVHSAKISHLYTGENNAADDKSYAEMFLGGNPPFSRAIMLDPDQSGRIILNSNAFALSRKIVVSPGDGNVVGGVNLNLDHLVKPSRSKGALIAPTTVMTYAQDAKRSAIKALSFAKAYLGPDSTLPSGKTAEDLIRHVKEKMYNLEETTASFGEAGEPHFKNGFGIFMLWIVPAIMNPQNCSLPKCIASNDREAGGKQSRKKARLKEKEKKRKDRDVESGTNMPLGPRGAGRDVKMTYLEMCNEFSAQLKDDERARKAELESTFQRCMSMAKFSKEMDDNQDAKRYFMEAKVAKSKIDSGEWKMSKKNQEYVNSKEEHFKLWSAGGADAGAGGGGKIATANDHVSNDAPNHYAGNGDGVGATADTPITGVARSDSNANGTNGNGIGNGNSGGMITLEFDSDSKLPMTTCADCDDEETNWYCRKILPDGTVHIGIDDEERRCGEPFCLGCVTMHCYHEKQNHEVLCLKHHPDSRWCDDN
jgi:hypothetical protein